MRRARLLALFLDALLCAAAADAVGLALTAAVWRLLPAARASISGIWAVVAAAGTAAFLLRDARGGLSRRWLALEARRPDGRHPGAWESIRRSLPLIVPLWNVLDGWPVLRDGEAPRRCDRASGIRILRIP